MAGRPKPIEIVCRWCQMVNVIEKLAEYNVLGGSCGKCGNDLFVSEMTHFTCPFCQADIPIPDPPDIEMDCPHCGRPV